jgi:hypothetical protein
MDTELTQLGDELQHAVATQIGGTISARRRRRRLSRTSIAALATVGVVAFGGAAAAAVSLLSSDTVAHGMPGSSAIFVGSDPTCSTTDHVVFDCKLAKAPVHEIDNFKGTKETFSDSHDDVAGGCIGQDSAGMHWICYAGQKAVEMDIIGPSLLGQHQTGPSVG